MDDDPVCADRATDGACTTQVQVNLVQAEVLPGDCNWDGGVDISDSICALLFLGAGIRPIDEMRLQGVFANPGPARIRRQKEGG